MDVRYISTRYEIAYSIIENGYHVIHTSYLCNEQAKVFGILQKLSKNMETFKVKCNINQLVETLVRERA